MKFPPTDNPFDENGRPSREWIDWFNVELYPRVSRDEGSGATADRPVNGMQVGSYYFDTDLGYIIHYDGTNWVDGTGATV